MGDWLDWLAERPGAALLLILALWLLGGLFLGEQAVIDHDNQPIDNTHTIQVEQAAP